MRNEDTHTKWTVYEDAVEGLVRVRYPLDPRFSKVERQYGITYRNKKPKGPIMLVKWLTQQEWDERKQMYGG